MKAAFWIAGIIVVVGGAFFALYAYTHTEDQAEITFSERGGVRVAHYTDRALGLSFEYRDEPDGYYLLKPEQRTSGRLDFVTTFVLTLKSEHDELAQSQGAREGPPTITVLVFKNAKTQEPRVWAEENRAWSNIELALGEVIETTLGGESAIRYRADGLYLSDNLVVAHGDFIFVISGMYPEEGSIIRRDFEPFLRSITWGRSSGAPERGSGGGVSRSGSPENQNTESGYSAGTGAWVFPNPLPVITNTSGGALQLFSGSAGKSSSGGTTNVSSGFSAGGNSSGGTNIFGGSSALQGGAGTGAGTSNTSPPAAASFLGTTNTAPGTSNTSSGTGYTSSGSSNTNTTSGTSNTSSGGTNMSSGEDTGDDRLPAPGQ